MKRTVLLYMAVMASIVLASCQSPSSKVDQAKNDKEKARKVLVKAQERYQIEMDSFKAAVATTIESNNELMKELRQKANDEKETERQRLNNKLDQLEEQNNRLKEKLANYQDKGDTAWSAFKTELNRDIEELGTAFKNLGTKNNK